MATSLHREALRSEALHADCEHTAGLDKHQLWRCSTAIWRACSLGEKVVDEADDVEVGKEGERAGARREHVFESQPRLLVVLEAATVAGKGRDGQWRETQVCLPQIAHTSRAADGA